MKLEVGMYVKYTRGAINGYVPPRIAKITDCSDKDLIKIDNGQVILKADILKASHNLLGNETEPCLIEVGDYVNGIEVIGKEFNNFNEEYLQCGVGDYVVCTYEIKDIKSIVTKEQFENNVYRIGD